MPKIKRSSADSWFSKCVRERSDWTCERCGAKHEKKSMGLHCAHFMTRGNWGTRFDPDNAMALCYGCHSYVDSRPYEKAEFFESKLGEGLVQIVREKAKRPAYGIKKMLKDISKHYREEHKKLEEKRKNGAEGYLDFEGYD